MAIPTTDGQSTPTAEAAQCPDCGRFKALSALDMALGLCPKWYATRDQMAEDDCKRAEAEAAESGARKPDMHTLRVLASAMRKVAPNLVEPFITCALEALSQEQDDDNESNDRRTRGMAGQGDEARTEAGRLNRAGNGGDSAAERDEGLLRPFPHGNQRQGDASVVSAPASDGDLVSMARYTPKIVMSGEVQARMEEDPNGRWVFYAAAREHIGAVERRAKSAEYDWQAAEAKLDAAMRVVAELVACKDLKDSIDKHLLGKTVWPRYVDAEYARRDFEDRDVLAWAAARALIAESGSKT